MTLYSNNSNRLIVPASQIPDSKSIQQMLQNIQDTGETEYIVGTNFNPKEFLETIGVKLDTSTSDIVLEEGINIDPLRKHIEHAYITDQSEPLLALLGRLRVINREHSVADLVKFLSKTRMPISKDGLLVTFKRLNINGAGTLVDCHSGLVDNSVGNYVYMDESLVDPDRTRDCSYGLHVASREYLAGFHGEALAIILVKPEDVIAVPEYDACKVRVCAYHVVDRIEKHTDIVSVLHGNYTDNVKRMLAKYISGYIPTVTKEICLLSRDASKIAVKEVTYITTSTEAETLPEEYTNEVEEAVKPDPVKVVRDITLHKRVQAAFVDFMKAPTHKNFLELEMIRKKQKKSYSDMGLSKADCSFISLTKGKNRW